MKTKNNIEALNNDELEKIVKNSKIMDEEEKEMWIILIPKMNETQKIQLKNILNIDPKN